MLTRAVSISSMPITPTWAWQKSRTRYSAFLDPKSDGRQEKMGRAYTHTYLVWTERGRKFIHDLAHRYWELCEVYS